MTERDRQREQTRSRVYEAALEIFGRDGVEGSRIDDITALAGVSRGTFYFHFPSKDDVLLELTQRSQLIVVERLAEVPPEAPIADALATVAACMAEQWQDDPQMLAALGMAALKHTAGGLEDVADQHPAALALVPRFAAAADRGEVSGLIPPELLSQFFLVNLFGAALAWCGNPVVGLDPLLRNVVAFFLRGAGR